MPTLGATRVFNHARQVKIVLPLLLLASSTPAWAQAAPVPLVAGAIVERFEMVPDRTVVFAPTGDGKLRIVTSTDNDRLAPMPRNPGEVAVSLTVAREIGAVLEFNSGLDFSFSYEARAGDAGIPTCPVRDNAVASDQWPQGYRSIVIGPLTRVERTAPCETAN
jgi:hypothetical protein